MGSFDSTEEFGLGVLKEDNYNYNFKVANNPSE